MIASLGQDLRHALRLLGRAPAFTLIVVATLALTFGANTAVFSIVDAVLLQPLTYRNPEQLVVVHDAVPRLGRAPTSGREFAEWRASTRSFDAMALLAVAPAIVTGGDDAERIDGARVSPTLFPMLGVSPALGRLFRSDEEIAGRDRVAILSNGFWRRRFGGEPGVVGRRLVLNDEAFTIVGVLPESFRFPRLEQLFAMPLSGGLPDVWMPFGPPPADRDENSFACIARLRAGVSVAQARDELNGIQAAIGRRFTPPLALGADVVPMAEQITGPVRDRLLFVWVGVVLLLLIACANITNLFLTRAARRRREFAIRAAVGASRRRLVQQALVETFVVSSVGGAAGVVLAYVAVPLFVAATPVMLPRLDEVTVDVRALIFGAAMSLISAAAVGILPALRSAGAEVSGAMRAYGAAGYDRRDRRARHVLVATQVALTVVCLFTAGLLIRSFVNVMQIDRGFSADHVLGFRAALPPSRYPSREAKSTFVRAALDRLRAIPDVRAVAVVNRLPLSGVALNTIVAASGTENAPIPVNERPLGDLRSVNPGYFRTLGIPLVQGRIFRDDDAHPVTVVSRRMAARLWPGENPIGRRVRLTVDPTRLFEVVGVVGDVRAMGLDLEPPLSIYLPYWQGFLNDLSFAVRTSDDELAVASPARAVIHALDSQLAIDDVRPVRQLITAAAAPRRVEATVLGLFGVAAMLLAGLGLYGVLSQSVVGRTRELGVRLALGATPAAVQRMVLTDAFRVVIIGVAIGAPGGLVTGLGIRRLLFGVNPENPAVLAGACAALLLIGGAAAHFPARRAARIDPIVSLRAE